MGSQQITKFILFWDFSHLFVETYTEMWCMAYIVLYQE